MSNERNQPKGNNSTSGIGLGSILIIVVILLILVFGMSLLGKKSGPSSKNTDSNTGSNTGSSDREPTQQEIADATTRFGLDTLVFANVSGLESDSNTEGFRNIEMFDTLQDYQRKNFKVMFSLTWNSSSDLQDLLMHANNINVEISILDGDNSLDYDIVSFNGDDTITSNSPNSMSPIAESGPTSNNYSNGLLERVDKKGNALYLTFGYENVTDDLYIYNPASGSLGTFKITFTLYDEVTVASTNVGLSLVLPVIYEYEHMNIIDVINTKDLFDKLFYETRLAIQAAKEEFVSNSKTAVGGGVAELAEGYKLVQLNLCEDENCPSGDTVGLFSPSADYTSIIESESSDLPYMELVSDSDMVYNLYYYTASAYITYDDPDLEPYNFTPIYSFETPDYKYYFLMNDSKLTVEEEEDGEFVTKFKVLINNAHQSNISVAAEWDVAYIEESTLFDFEYDINKSVVFLQIPNIFHTFVLEIDIDDLTWNYITDFHVITINNDSETVLNTDGVSNTEDVINSIRKNIQTVIDTTGIDYYVSNTPNSIAVPYQTKSDSSLWTNDLLTWNVPTGFSLEYTDSLNNNSFTDNDKLFQFPMQNIPQKITLTLRPMCEVIVTGDVDVDVTITFTDLESNVVVSKTTSNTYLRHGIYTVDFTDNVNYSGVITDKYDINVTVDELIKDDKFLQINKGTITNTSDPLITHKGYVTGIDSVFYTKYTYDFSMKPWCVETGLEGPCPATEDLCPATGLEGPCPATEDPVVVNYSWVEGSFSSCMRPYSGTYDNCKGSQVKYVTCLGDDGIEYDDGDCNAVDKPVISQDCNVDGCECEDDHPECS